MAVFSCLAFAPASGGLAPAQPPWYTIRLITANGSGCPQGTKTSVSQGPGPELAVTYSDYIAYAGNGARPDDFRKNCVLSIRVGVPSGWTFGIAQATYRGYANLDVGATGTVEADYWLQGLPWTVQSTRNVRGPTNHDYAFTDVAPVGSFAVCHTGTALNVDTSVRVSAGSGKSSLNESAMVDSLSATLHFDFAPC
jgi:hypothetical protein